MFYSHDILRKNGRFSVIWLSAMVTDRSRSRYVKKADVLRVDVEKMCEDIIEHVVFGKVNAAGGPRAKSRQVPFSLYLSSQLMFGLVLVFEQQMATLLIDIRSLQRSLTTMPAPLAYPGEGSILLQPDLYYDLAWTVAPGEPPPSFSGYGRIGDDSGAVHGDDSASRMIRDFEMEHMSIHSARSSELASDLMSSDEYNAKHTVPRDRITMRESVPDGSLQLPHHFPVLGDDLEPMNEEFTNMMQRMSATEFVAALDTMNLEPSDTSGQDQQAAEPGYAGSAGSSDVVGEQGSDTSAIPAVMGTSEMVGEAGMIPTGEAVMTPALGPRVDVEVPPGAPDRPVVAPVRDDVTARDRTLANNTVDAAPLEPPSHIFRLPELSDSQLRKPTSKSQRRRRLVPTRNANTQLPKEDMKKMIDDPTSILRSPDENLAKVVGRNSELDSLFNSLSMFNVKPSLTPSVSERLQMMYRDNCYTRREPSAGNACVLEDIPWFMREPEPGPDLYPQDGGLRLDDGVESRLPAKRVRISDEVMTEPPRRLADETIHSGSQPVGRMDPLVEEVPVADLSGNLSRFADRSSESSIEVGRDRSSEIINVGRRESDLPAPAVGSEDSNLANSTLKLGTTMERIIEHEGHSFSDAGSIAGVSGSDVGSLRGEGDQLQLQADVKAQVDIANQQFGPEAELDPVEAHRRRVEERKQRRKEYMRQKYPDCYSSSSSSDASSLSAVARPMKWAMSEQELQRMIENNVFVDDSGDSGSVSFTDLCPPGPAGVTRIQAAKCFGLLLGMKKNQSVDLKQEEPFGPIFISAIAK